jgi:hypothetical protein
MLTSSLNTAFIDAMHNTGLISAGITLYGTLMALLFSFCLHTRKNRRT